MRQKECVVLFYIAGKINMVDGVRRKKNKIKHKSKIAAFEIKWCEAI